MREGKNELNWNARKRHTHTHWLFWSLCKLRPNSKLNKKKALNSSRFHGNQVWNEIVERERKKANTMQCTRTETSTSDVKKSPNYKYEHNRRVCTSIIQWKKLLRKIKREGKHIAKHARFFPFIVQKDSQKWNKAKKKIIRKKYMKIELQNNVQIERKIT